MPPTPSVCLVNCLHPPDDVRVVDKMGRLMCESGFHVTWVGPESAQKQPRFGMDYHFYPAAKGRAGRLVHNHRRAFRVASKLPRADVYIGVEPDSAAVAIRLARRFRSHAVFDVHEAYEADVLRSWVQGPAQRVAIPLVRWGLRGVGSKSDLIVGVNEAVLEPYSSLSTPRMVVRNCAPVSFADGPPAKLNDPKRTVFYAMQGKATMNHGTPAVIEAFGLARRKAPGVRVIFFDTFEEGNTGLDAPRFQELVKRAKAEEAVELRPRIPASEMPAVLRTCELGLVTYNRVFGVKSLPNKLFEFMALGLPVIAPSYAQEIRPIVEQERCGLLVDCEDPAQIAEAVVYLRAHPEEAAEMGRRGREAFIARHNFQADAKALLDQIRDWAVSQGGPRA